MTTMKSINYIRKGDCLYPALYLPQHEQHTIGIWGYRRLNFLKENRKTEYVELLFSGKLHEHLADTDRRAEECYERLMTEMAKAEGVTEGLKADDQMLWVRKMNSIRMTVMEIITDEMIYA